MIKLKKGILFSLVAFAVLSVVGLLYGYVATRSKYTNTQKVLFGEVSITFEFIDGATLVAFDWMRARPVQMSFQETNTTETLNMLFRDAENAAFPTVVYNTLAQKYYILDPGGYSSVSVVTQEYFNKKMVEEISEESTYEGEKTIYRKHCAETTFDTNQIKGWREITCTEYVTDAVSTREVGFTKACYVKLDNTRYLEFDSPVKSAGSEILWCNTIYMSGLRSVRL